MAAFMCRCTEDYQASTTICAKSVVAGIITPFVV